MSRPDTVIYFDMDGVLADFDRGVRELCHMEPVVQGSGAQNDDRLWAAVRQVPHFYDRLEPIDGAVEMFRAAQERYGERCQILTGIPRPFRGIVTAREDKIAWARRLLSPDVRIHVVYREQKPEFCSGPDSVLIDDYQKNIHEWEQSGGTGILFRSPTDVLRRLDLISGNE